MPIPGVPSIGAWAKTKRNCELSAHCNRRVWILNTVEFDPPPWRHKMAGRGLPEESCCGASEPMFLVKRVLVDNLQIPKFLLPPAALKHVRAISESVPPQP